MAKKFLFGFFIIGLISNSSINAETPVPAGDVSGTWTLAGSPYNVQGDITVPAGATLTIDPGVTVAFQGGYKLSVDGYLQAVGTETDSIHFLSASTSWQGIDLTFAPDTSHLIYCTFSKGGGIVCGWGSSPVISHCTFTSGSGYAVAVNFSGSPEISHCNIEHYGQGIYWESGDGGTISDCHISHCSNGCGIYLRTASGTPMTIIDCIISDNINNSSDGIGGIYSQNAHLSLINCIIRDNFSVGLPGGGVRCNFSDVTLTHCTINGNVCYNTSSPIMGGGAISIEQCNATLSYCSIYDNYCEDHVGGISVNGGDLTVDHCTIDGDSCRSPDKGCGISMQSNNTAIIKNSVISNHSTGCGIYNLGTLTVEYTDFYHNPGGNITGSVPAGFGTLSTANANGDSCDVYGNIFMRPLFADTADFDYHLTENSPCIDAGDPADPKEPDGTITDMGRFFFDQRAPEIRLSDTLLDFGQVLIGQQADTTLKVYNEGTDTLRITAVTHDQDAFTTDFNQTVHNILPGDSLSIVITFDPLSAGPVNDTLHINSNCQNCSVRLTGTGQSTTGIFDVPVNSTQQLLCLAYPNPFYSDLSIQLDLPTSGFVILTIYNAYGEVVSTLMSKEMAAGTYHYQWNADGLPQGTYLLRLQVGNRFGFRKIIKL